MNYTVIFKLLSVIMAAIGIALSVSLGAGYVAGDHLVEAQALHGFGISICIAFGLSVALYILGLRGDFKMLRKEALCVIGLGWILSCMTGALPYFLVIPGCSLADAVFESVSGLTTTGATVFTDLEQFPRSLMFWRQISQWIGGLGVVVFFVAILSFLGAGAKILYSRESSAESTELESSRVQSGVLRILYLYLAISAVCALVYRLCGMSWYDAICHMFTTIATGGFSTYSNSIAAFHSPLIEWMFILFMIVGGTSFLVILRSLRGQWKDVLTNTEIRVFYAILAIATLVITLLLLINGIIDTPLEALRASAFHVVSVATTSGFTTTDFDAWIPATHAFLLALMVIGGSSGSTAGGLKVIRVVIGIKICLVNIEKAFRSRVVRPIKVNGRNVSAAAQENIVIYIVLLTIILFISKCVVALLEHNLSLEGTYSTVISCFYNVGPGFDEIGPNRTYAFFHDSTKYYLSLLMIMGRLELYAILVLFVPSFWRRFS